MSFDIPFRVDTGSATLEVITEQEGFTLEEVALTVLRLGDAA